jgi:hypothetical protein
MSEWISGSEAARIIDTSRATVLRSLQDPAARERWWGAEGVGWRHKPLIVRLVFQVSRARAEEIAKNPPTLGPETG